MNKKSFFLAIVAVLSLIGNAFCQTEEIELNLDTEKVFKLSPVIDGTLFGAGATLITTEIILNKCGVKSKTLDQSVVFDKDSINAFDRWAMRSYSKGLDLTGSAFEAVMLLSPAILLTTGKSEWITIGAMYAETLMLAYGAKELSKNIVNRVRPYMYFDGAPQKEIDKGDWNCSFFSGHTTMSFAAASFTSFVFAEYFPTSMWKIPVIVASYSMATATAALRLASGNHFMTDVLVGAAVGSAIGIGVPLLHKIGLNKERQSHIAGDVDVVLLPNGVNVSINM